MKVETPRDRQLTEDIEPDMKMFAKELKALVIIINLLVLISIILCS